MKKRTREILALLLLAILGIGVAIAMAWYIFVGHTWTVAATNTDASIGEMDGYSVLVYGGQSLRESERNRLSDEQPLLVDENRGPASVDDEDALPAEPVSAYEVASSYRQKAASVFVLHLEYPNAYADPVVLSRNGTYIGVFSVDGTMTRSQVKKAAMQLANREVDFVVAIVSDARILDDPVEGVDMVVCTTDEDIAEPGSYAGNMFCVDSPYVGEVQAIIVSPSGVLSSKTVTGV